MKYEELSEEEKAALEVALFSHYSAIRVLRTLFGNQSSDSTLYRYMYIGQDSLVKKGILSSNNKYQLTDVAFTIIPPEKFAKTFQTLTHELDNRRDKLTEAEQRTNSLELNIKNLTNDKEKLEQIVHKFQLIGQTLDAFRFLGIDENWISALVCSTILEFSVKDKLEKMGCPANEIAHLNFENLMKKFNESLREKEGRNYEGLFEPEAIRSTRNKLVHEGYKTKIDRDEANAVFVITKNIVKNISGSK